MSFGELIAQLLGWSGEFVEWIISWIPRYEIVQWNQRGVRYIRGKQPTAVDPGLRWYWPWQTTIVKHHVNRQVLRIATLSLETADETKVGVGMVLTYFINDVLKYEVENFDADDSLAEVAQGGLRRIVTNHNWADLCVTGDEGTVLERTLKESMSKDLKRFGVRVESCRPTDLVQLDMAFRAFGVNQMISVVTTE